MFNYKIEEPKADVGFCVDCDELYLLEDCPTGIEKLEVGGQIYTPACPTCGNFINEYFYSEENAKVWMKWKGEV